MYVLPDDLASSISSTLQHISLLQQKEARLVEAREGALEQVIHSIGSAHRAGMISDAQLCVAFERIRQSKVPGRMSFWDGHVDIRWKQMVHLKRHLPNAPEGTWLGEYPFPKDSATPRPGTPVVYVLYDAENVPCYVGSTEHFRTRMAQHHREGKPFIRWHAHPCHDRERAYLLEGRLLREHKPYLNRKTSR